MTNKTTIMSCAVASVEELNSKQFTDFMSLVNEFAKQYGLRQFTNWSKVWEYPWLWFNGMSSVMWPGKKVLDLGSEISPMPWYLASLGAQVMLVECDSQWVAQWERLRKETGFEVAWEIVGDEKLPFRAESFDVVTSFSVIEHQTNKTEAVNEVVRVLRPHGKFFISFDICEPSLGMTFPDWNGEAVTVNQFNKLIWQHPAFIGSNDLISFDVDLMRTFIAWHLQSAPHHNYAVGAAILERG